jgi:hypothetical protein
VCRVDDRPQERDRDGLDFVPAEVLGRVPDRVLVERRQHAAAHVDAPRDADAQEAVDERLRGREADVEALGLERVAEVQDVAKALGAQQPDARAVALDHRVGGDRRPVHEQPGLPEHLLERDAAGGGKRAQTFQDRPHRIVGGRGLLPQPDVAVLVDHREVGERPPDVDTDSQHQSSVLGTSAG